MLTREWIVRQFQSFINWMIQTFGLIKTYDTMPSDDVLSAMSGNTKFRTLGYYTKYDGCGGIYTVTGSWKGKAITYNGATPTKFLVAIDEPNNDNDIIPVHRYGIRKSTLSVSNATIEDTFAEQNTAIIKNLMEYARNCATFVFPQGNFYFSEPLVSTSKQYNLKGYAIPIINKKEVSIDTSNSRNLNTALMFPFLSSSQSAIEWSGGTIENILVVGNHNTYNIVFNRANIGTEEAAWTETIATNEDTQIKCRGILAKKCVINNVNVAYFYTGIKDVGSSSYYSNVYAYACHYGFLSQTDTKWRGVYGWNVHTLFSCRGSLVSVIQLRCDNCVHLIELNSCANVNIIDADGDYCMDSLVVVQRESGQSPARGINLIGLHGRANMDKVYDITEYPNGLDVRNLTDTSGYGLISITSGGSLSNSRIVLNSIGNSSRDGGENDNHRTPNILLTYGAMTDATRCINNTFVLANSTGIDSSEDLKKVLQLKPSENNRIDTAKDTYYVKGSEVTTSMDGLKALVLSSTDFADLQAKLGGN